MLPFDNDEDTYFGTAGDMNKDYVVIGGSDGSYIFRWDDEAYSP